MDATNWTGIELRHLVALVAVADQGTFSAAADRLGYTQSAVSQQIATLERIVGATLFERPGGPRPVRLTEAGQALVGHARSVLARLRTAEADLRALAVGDRGVLRIGTVQSVGTKVLPAALRDFCAAHPGVEITLRESHEPDELLALVEEGELDATFYAPLPLTTGPFEARWLLDDPYVFVAAAGAPEAAGPTVRIEDIGDLPFVSFRAELCRQIVEDYFQERDVTPRFVFFSDDNTTVQGCIAAGLGYGVLPLLTVDENDPSVAVAAIDPPALVRRIGMAWHAERRPPAALPPFVDAVAEVCDRLSARWRAMAHGALAH